MDQEAIIQYITETFTGVEVVRPTDGPGAGDTLILSATLTRRTGCPSPPSSPKTTATLTMPHI